MVTTKIFQHKQTTSYIFGPDPPSEESTERDSIEGGSTTSSIPWRFQCVRVPQVEDLEEHIRNPGEDVVDEVLEEIEDAGGNLRYNVRFGDGGEYLVSDFA